MAKTTRPLFRPLTSLVEWRGGAGLALGSLAFRCCFPHFPDPIASRFIHGHTRQRAFALAIQRLAIYSAFFQLSAFMFSFPFASRLQFRSGSVHHCGSGSQQWWLVRIGWLEPVRGEQ